MEILKSSELPIGEAGEQIDGGPDRDCEQSEAKRRTKLRNDNTMPDVKRIPSGDLR